MTGIIVNNEGSSPFGFFSNDQRYGPGILITMTSTTYELNVGYWKNDRLIRLKKSALNNQEFHFMKQFPQYNFYKLVNLELMFQNNQYQKSIKQEQNNLLINEQIYHYDQSYFNESLSLLLFNNSSINSTELLIQIIQNILKQSNLPKSFQVWNMKSPLFERFIADQSFKHLLHCIPTPIESSLLNFNNLQQMTETMGSIQNDQKVLDAEEMQSLLITLSNNANMFGMRSSPSKCKILLADWVASTPELMIGSVVVERVDRATYLGSIISLCGLMYDEISSLVQKSRLAFANLRHLWRRRDIRLPTKGRVH
ncbi:unnamed protein product [Schistosoma margrebowiei]|uniref:Uncharacterized protein n=1 Tax=Schistosoma margrebowiei TaxID=48269 RepID=A0A183M358_9TREM|nr:unnamed protein product [Schistosoma margrebowiei]